MDDREFTISGLSEVTESFEKIIKAYPDKAGDLLRKNAFKLRKEVVNNVKSDTKSKGKSKKSLAKLGSYKVSQVKGIGENQYVEISAKSPHFHLVEHGHNLVIKGKNIGFVPGKHMMEKAAKNFEDNSEQMAQELIDKLLKEGGY